MKEDLLFHKKNNIHEYSVIFCIDSVFDKVNDVLSKRKPSCLENIYITKIYI